MRQMGRDEGNTKARTGARASERGQAPDRGERLGITLVRGRETVKGRSQSQEVAFRRGWCPATIERRTLRRSG